MSALSKVSTCLWFDREAEEAAAFYCSLLPGSEVTAVSRYGAGAPMPEGLALTVGFRLAGTEYMALNGGPAFALSEAVSIIVQCGDQAEIDRLWAALTAGGGKELQCGWLKDRFGLCWQIVPASIAEWMASGDASAKGRMMAALMQMVKLDIATLDKAFRGE